MSKITTHRMAILMSAYGASDYLAEQVLSISTQLNAQDILIIVDDGSRNVKWELLHGLPENYIFWTRMERLGVGPSFMDLITESEVRAEYYFLADQDDLWMPNKLNIQREQHKFHNGKFHATVHSWYLLGNSSGRRINSSAINPMRKLSDAHYCFETPAPGMTLSFTDLSRQLLIKNRSLLTHFSKSLPHDRILVAFLSMLGELDILPDALVRYRQHTENLVGAPLDGKLRRWIQRMGESARAWTTVTQGCNLYLALIELKHQSSAPMEEMRKMFKMRLRSMPLDNLIMHFMVRILATLNRLHLWRLRVSA